MSTERHEIIDEGSQIRILYSGSISTIISGPLGTHIEDAVIGAIRQQAHDLALLTQMLHDQRLVIDDLEHRRVKVCDENDQLRTDLAAAVAENAALLAANRDCILHFDAIKADYDVMKLRAEQAEARLAAIDAAPVVASVGHGDYLHRHTASVPVGTLLIARLAKD